MEPLSTADKRKAGQVPKTTKNAVNIYICSALLLTMAIGGSTGQLL